jgi:hypothetical protein
MYITPTLIHGEQTSVGHVCEGFKYLEIIAELVRAFDGVYCLISTSTMRL